MHTALWATSERRACWLWSHGAGQQERMTAAESTQASALPAWLPAASVQQWGWAAGHMASGWLLFLLPLLSFLSKCNCFCNFALFPWFSVSAVVYLHMNTHDVNVYTLYKKRLQINVLLFRKSLFYISLLLWNTVQRHTFTYTYVDSPLRIHEHILTSKHLRETEATYLKIDEVTIIKFI